ncbi:MAG TPA: hypothetical protein VGF12_11190 [Roseateles sp.]|uniref:hypothetical protein n=1 Tax=Roseateles sp. TaxID=1971397 RepID=UPI002ED926D5
MNLITKFLALASTAMLAASVQAQFVKGNEAVTIRADGSREVATPPLPSFKLGPPCQADNPGCASRGWLMLETREGLRECTEFYARPGTCRASTYGAVQRPRLWVIRVQGKWLQCPRPDVTSGCVSTKALPPVAQLQ